MSTWSVEVPIAGRAIVEVEADTADGAIDAALNTIDSMEYVEEWSAYKELSRGNVSYAPLNAARATKVED